MTEDKSPMPNSFCNWFEKHDPHEHSQAINIFETVTSYCSGFDPESDLCDHKQTHDKHLYLKAGEWFECPGFVLTVKDVLNFLSNQPLDGVVRFTSCCCGEGMEVNDTSVIPELIYND